MFIWLLACQTPEAILTFNPNPLDLGTVPFVNEMPEGGYAQAQVSLKNEGEEDIFVTLPPIDADRLCVEGFPDPSQSYDLDTLPPGGEYLLNVGVCGHIAGELDMQIDTSLSVHTDGDPVVFTLDITYFLEQQTQ